MLILWRHQMETFSALLGPLCWAGSSLVTGVFPFQRPVTHSFDVFLDLHQHELLSKQSWRRWFETPSRCNKKEVIYINIYIYIYISFIMSKVAIDWKAKIVMFDMMHAYFSSLIKFKLLIRGTCGSIIKCVIFEHIVFTAGSCERVAEFLAECHST